MGINVLVFFAVFLTVSSNQRLAADDFHYLLKTQQLGIWDSAVYYYNHWNTRWSSSLLRAIFLQLFGSAYSVLAVNCFSLILGVVSIKSLINSLVKASQIPFTSSKQWILSAYLLMAIFLATFGKADTWFWLSSTPSYLWGCFAAILGGAFLLKTGKSKLRTSLTVLAFVYVGGSSESVALATIIALFYLGFMTKKQEQFIPINRKALHLATVVCLVSFGITLVGPGLDVRKEYLPHYPISDKLLIGFWNYFKFNFKEIPLVIPLVILAVTPFGFLGRKQLRFQLISIREIFWANKKLWGLADMTIAIIAFSLAMIMGEMGPTRTWVPLSFIVVTIAVFIAYQLGTWVYIKSNGKLIHLVIAAQIVLLLFQGFTGFMQLSITNNYATKVDQRMEFIPSLKPNSKTIHSLHPLPDSGWLFSSEISSDTAHFANDHLELFFSNRYNLAVKETVPSTAQ